MCTTCKQQHPPTAVACDSTPGRDIHTLASSGLEATGTCQAYIVARRRSSQPQCSVQHKWSESRQRGATMKVALALLLLASLVAVNAFPMFQQEIPNIPIVNGQPWPGVGHNNPAGGGSRNVFGKDFEAAGYMWTAELCRKDSDGDGFTNGQELGDPNCTWMKGQPRPALPAGTTPSHPGLSTSAPQAVSG